LSNQFSPAQYEIFISYFHIYSVDGTILNTKNANNIPGKLSEFATNKGCRYLLL